MRKGISPVIRMFCGAYHVWVRNALVFRKNLMVNFLPPFIEPILYLAAMGFGLGSFVGEIDGTSYVRFIAPAIIASSLMNASFFECSYATFVRIHYQKTVDAIMATPVSVAEIVLGEILWGATRALIYASCILVVLVILGLADLPSSLIVLPLAFIAGILFASIAMCFTAVTPSIDALNYPAFLFITPMFLFSGTFFPLKLLPEPIQILALAVLPLTHVVALIRGVVISEPVPLWALHLVWIIGGSLLITALSIKLIERRLII